MKNSRLHGEDTLGLIFEHVQTALSTVRYNLPDSVTGLHERQIRETDAMIDFGVFQVEMEVINWVLVTTGFLLAVLYLGVEIIGAIAGVAGMIMALRSLLYDYPFSFAGIELGTYACWGVLIVGAYLAYRGLTGMLEPKGTEI